MPRFGVYVPDALVGSCFVHPSLFFKERDVRQDRCKPNCRSEYKWLAGTPTTRAPGLASPPTGIPARQRQFGLHPAGQGEFVFPRKFYIHTSSNHITTR